MRDIPNDSMRRGSDRVRVMRYLNNLRDKERMHCSVSYIHTKHAFMLWPVKGIRQESLGA